MPNFISELPFNLVIFIAFAAMGMLLAAAFDFNLPFRIFGPRNRHTETDTQTRKPANIRLAARIIAGICASLIICSSLFWLSNYNYY